MSTDQSTVPNVPVDSARAGVRAAYAALTQEIDRVLGVAGEARRSVDQPLATVRAALDEVDPAAAPLLGAALDVLEDVLESRLRASGWPARAAGRGEAA
jgi:hypothetical protein